jgi:PadR family transcriptional regulator, regulatory protein PadR
MGSQKNKHEDPQLEGKAPIKAAALAVLLEAPGHGYDVARRINRRMGISWDVNEKHIYSILKQLEKAGLVRSAEGSTREPPYWRRVYYPTDRAEQARREWLTTPPAMTIVRADIHARLAFSTEEDAPELLRALDRYRSDLLEAIEENAATATPKVSWLGRVICLSRSAVEKRLEAELEWIGEAHRELEGALAKRSER